MRSMNAMELMATLDSSRVQLKHIKDNGDQFRIASPLTAQLRHIAKEVEANGKPYHQMFVPALEQLAAEIDRTAASLT